jgi:D-sedoheptulose 7-phosphate isomerase
LVSEGDVVVGLSTSGESPNVIRALQVAKQKGAVTVGLTGQRGSKISEVCDLCIKVPSGRTARIQEAHIVIGHIVCRLIEEGATNV